MAIQASREVSLQHHKATHPRLGAIDHIVCQYLPSEGQVAEAAAAAAARGIAAAVAGEVTTLPVVLYGDACGSARRLQDIRRACGALSSMSTASKQSLAAVLRRESLDFDVSSARGFLFMWPATAAARPNAQPGVS